MNQLPRRFLSAAALSLLCLVSVACPAVAAQDEETDRDRMQALTGHWVFNEKASDETDKQVEVALKAMGQKTSKGWFNSDDEYYRGGPPEQELYDRISYDRVLTIEAGEDQFLFTYDDDYRRPVYTDNRHRSVSLTGLDEAGDFSFGHWEGEVLEVEARPRDGGFAEESYRLINDGTQLELKIYAQPRSFTVPVEVRRVFDRKS